MGFFERREIGLATMEWVAVLAGVALGIAGGIGSFTFLYARGLSYMTDDPEACANCHIMQDHFDAWAKGSHHAVAVCNDCHTPHNFFGKYLTKATNGYHHSFAFTTGYFHEPIQITKGNKEVTEQTCRYCHADITHAIDWERPGVEELNCIDCHRWVGHME